MCNLDSSVKGQKVGWKVVAIKPRSKNYFSPATGCIYRSGKEVTKVKKQKRLTDYFRNDILYSTRMNNPLMCGRTSIFKFKEDANNLLIDINESRSVPGVNFKVVKAIVSKKVMEGTYNGPKIYAGRIITFLDN